MPSTSRPVSYTHLIEINDRSSVKMQHFTCGFFNTTHSIPDSLGILINTPNGRIVHTGDFKFDLTPVGTNSDYQVMAYMGQIGVDLLLSDSTNSGVEDFSISEKKVAAEILDTMKKTSGRLIVATFASNVYRVSQILEAAVACGRKVIIFGRSMENVVTIGRKMGKIKVGEQHFLSPDQLSRTPANKTCIVCTGSQGEPLAALSRIANGTHRYIKLIPGDTVVFSSSPIPGNGASAVSYTHLDVYKRQLLMYGICALSSLVSIVILIQHYLIQWHKHTALIQRSLYWGILFLTMIPGYMTLIYIAASAAIMDICLFVLLACIPCYIGFHCLLMKRITRESYQPADFLQKRLLRALGGFVLSLFFLQLLLPSSLQPLLYAVLLAVPAFTLTCMGCRFLTAYRLFYRRKEEFVEFEHMVYDEDAFADEMCIRDRCMGFSTMYVKGQPL